MRAIDIHPVQRHLPLRPLNSRPRGLRMRLFIHPTADFSQLWQPKASSPQKALSTGISFSSLPRPKLEIRLYLFLSIDRFIYVIHTTTIMHCVTYRYICLQTYSILLHRWGVTRRRTPRCHERTGSDSSPPRQGRAGRHWASGHA